MKKHLLLFFLLIFAAIATAQKTTQQVFESGNIEKLVLESDEIYKITVITAPVKTITVNTKTDGEYFNDISLDSEVAENTLYLRSRFREILQSGFDKLSAHKVFAMELELEIPKNVKIEINSNVASVFIKGDYDEVFVQLKTGSCYLQDFTGDATVNTYDGNIEVTTHDAQVEAETRHGEINLPQDIVGSHHISLTSINGNIKVQETK